LLSLPITIRGKGLAMTLTISERVISSNKTRGQFPKLTLSISEKKHFFPFIGDVPKMALAIYMRGEKKS